MSSTASSDIAGLLSALADGNRHGTGELTALLGLSGEALAESVSTLRNRGFPVTWTADGGVLWNGETPKLDSARIRADLGRRRLPRVPVVEVLDETTSTNDVLRQRRPTAPTLLLSERQTAGRGRRGRDWLAAPGGIYASLAWTFRNVRGAPVGLSVLCGVELALALREAGMPSVAVKWPNDLVVDDAKLGGILVDVSFAGASTCHAVVGVGLNFLPPVRPPADRAVCGLAPWWLDVPDARNAIAALAGGALVTACGRYPRDAASRLASAWPEVDALAGRRVRVTLQDTWHDGNAAGINVDGALRVELDGMMRTFHAGDVSVRPQQ